MVIKEIQDHLLGEIKAEDPSEKCLLETRKIESKIEQRKLLGIKTAMTYDSIQHTGRGKYHIKAKVEDDPVAILRIASIVVSPTIRATAQCMAKDVKNVGKITTLKPCVN